MIKTINKIFQILKLKKSIKFYSILFLATFIGLFEVAGVVSIMPFISLVSNPDVIYSNKYFFSLFNFLNVSEINFIIFFGFIVFGLMVLNTLLNILFSYFLYKFVYGRFKFISNYLFKKYINQNYEKILEKNTYYISKVLNIELITLIDGPFVSIMNLISRSIIIFLISITLFYINFYLTFSILLIFLVFYGSIVYITKKKLVNYGKLVAEGNTYKQKIVNEVFFGFKEIIFFKQIIKNISLFDKYIFNFANSKIKFLILQSIPKYTFEILIFGSGIFIIVLNIKNNNLLIDILPTIGLFTIAAYRMFPSFNVIFQAITSLNFYKKNTELVYEEIQNLKKHKIIKENSLLNFEHTIEIKDVSFSYNNSSNNVLENLNIILKKNTLTAVIGKSGSGKSTLIDIIAGLLKPKEGNLKIDNVNIEEKNISNWQEKIGYLPQNFFILNESILYNLTYQNEISQQDHQKLLTILKDVGLHDFIYSKKENINFNVGENGKYLSGGQKQRLGIARCLYKGAKLIILDEPTSNLDKQNSKKFFDLIYKLKKNTTFIISTHDEIDFDYFDKIIKL